MISLLFFNYLTSSFTKCVSPVTTDSPPNANLSVEKAVRLIPVMLQMVNARAILLGKDTIAKVRTLCLTVWLAVWLAVCAFALSS